MTGANNKIQRPTETGCSISSGVTERLDDLGFAVLETLGGVAILLAPSPEPVTKAFGVFVVVKGVQDASLTVAAMTAAACGDQATAKALGEVADVTSIYGPAASLISIGFSLAYDLSEDRTMRNVGYINSALGLLGGRVSDIDQVVERARSGSKLIQDISDEIREEFEKPQPSFDNPGDRRREPREPREPDSVPGRPGELGAPQLPGPRAGREGREAVPRPRELPAQKPLKLRNH